MFVILTDFSLCLQDEESVRKLDEEISNGDVKDEPTIAITGTEEEKSSSPSDDQPPESSVSNVSSSGNEGKNTESEKVSNSNDFKNEDDEKVNNNFVVDVKSCEQTNEDNKMNDLDAEENGGVSEDDVKIQTHPIIEDELKTEVCSRIHEPAQLILCRLTLLCF